MVVQHRRHFSEAIRFESSFEDKNCDSDNLGKEKRHIMASPKSPGKILSGDIKGLKNGKKLLYLDVYVHKVVTDDTFVVGDKSDHILLDLSKKPEFTKQVAAGKCIRIPKPLIENLKLVVEGQFGPCVAKPFKVTTLSKKVLDGYKVQEFDVNDIKTIHDVCQVTESCTVEPLYLKVTFVSNDKMIKQDVSRLIKVKDVRNGQRFLRFYGDKRKTLLVNTVYRFVGLIANVYEKNGETEVGLRSTSKVEIQEVSNEISACFDNIHSGDRVIAGTVIGHESVRFYECCWFCKRTKFKGQGLLCLHCGVKIEKGPAARDFSVNLVVSDESGDNLVKVMVFRSQLGLDFNKLTEDQVTKELEDRTLQKCVVDYDSSLNEGKDCIKAETIKFSPDLDYSDVSQNLSLSLLDSSNVGSATASSSLDPNVGTSSSQSFIESSQDMAPPSSPAKRKKNI